MVSFLLRPGPSVTSFPPQALSPLSFYSNSQHPHTALLGSEQRPVLTPPRTLSVLPHWPSSASTPALPPPALQSLDSPAPICSLTPTGIVCSEGLRTLLVCHPPNSRSESIKSVRFSTSFVAFPFSHTELLRFTMSSPSLSQSSLITWPTFRSKWTGTKGAQLLPDQSPDWERLQLSNGCLFRSLRCGLTTYSSERPFLSAPVKHHLPYHTFCIFSSIPVWAHTFCL